MRKVKLLLIPFFVLACTSAPVKYQESKEEGQWEAKAQLKDLRNNSSKTVSLEIMAVKDQALRMEVSGALGVQVASLLMKKSNVNCLVHTQKKSFEGEASERSLRPILKMDIDPRWLYSIFFDEAIEGWACTGSPIEKCERDDGLSVLWSERNGEKKRVTFNSDQFQLQILVKNYLTKVQSPDKVFRLSVPESYKKYKLN